MESGEDLGRREGLGENIENSEGKLREEREKESQRMISSKDRGGKKSDSLGKANPRRCPRGPPLVR